METNYNVCDTNDYHLFKTCLYSYAHTCTNIKEKKSNDKMAVLLTIVKTKRISKLSRLKRNNRGFFIFTTKL